MAICTSTKSPLKPIREKKLVNATGTYDTPNAREATLEKLREIFRRESVKRIFAKRLSPNDNSKNQPYFGPHLTDLGFLPTGQVTASESSSQKPGFLKDEKRRIKYQASMHFVWIDADGKKYPAPHAKLIYYPQYPETRFSGFLQGSEVEMSEWMQPAKRGRSEGRWLILGVTATGLIYGFLATPESTLAAELEATVTQMDGSVFGEISSHAVTGQPARATLLAKLFEVYQKGWIRGQKLNRHGVAEPYTARNAGGYTLEAELGVIPNGFAEPDFMGWEVKQFGVSGFPKKGASPSTLFTPEPDGGLYIDQGAHAFIRKFGYADKSGKPDRFNFGGVHTVGKICVATGLSLRVSGFNEASEKIADANGAVVLMDATEAIAASWSFAKLMGHWKRKHSQAVYVPCLNRTLGEVTEYCYGSDVSLGTGTSFEMMLSAMVNGHVYYDPGLKLEKASSVTPAVKKRSQFRVAHRNLHSLYRRFETVELKS